MTDNRIDPPTNVDTNYDIVISKDGTDYYACINELFIIVKGESPAEVVQKAEEEKVRVVQKLLESKNIAVLPRRGAVGATGIAAAGKEGLRDFFIKLGAILGGLLGLAVLSYMLFVPNLFSGQSIGLVDFVNRASRHVKEMPNYRREQLRQDVRTIVSVIAPVAAELRPLALCDGLAVPGRAQPPSQ